MVAEERDDSSAIGGESRIHLLERVLAALGDMPPRTLVVAHAGPIRLALEHLGQPSISPGPCEWVDLAPSSAGEAEQPFPVVAEVLSGGEFVGKAIYVTNHEDLDRIDSETLVLLCECPKAVAIEAMVQGAATVNLMRSLTAHLTYGRVSSGPYAVALRWPDGYPRDGRRIRLSVSPPPQKSGTAPLPDIPLARCDGVDLLGGKGAGLRLLETIGVTVPRYRVISTTDVAEWQASGALEEHAADWVRWVSLDSSATWAVRSSADLEDSATTP